MEISGAVQKSEHLKRENERMKILTADLASQVREHHFCLTKSLCRSH